MSCCWNLIFRCNQISGKAESYDSYGGHMIFTLNYVLQFPYIVLCGALFHQTILTEIIMMKLSTLNNLSPVWLLPNQAIHIQAVAFFCYIFMTCSLFHLQSMSGTSLLPLIVPVLSNVFTYVLIPSLRWP